MRTSVSVTSCSLSSSPISVRACAVALAIVAVQHTNCGDGGGSGIEAHRVPGALADALADDATAVAAFMVWCSAHTRLKRRIMSAQCAPNAPRYACASSNTTKRKPEDAGKSSKEHTQAEHANEQAMYRFLSAVSYTHKNRSVSVILYKKVDAHSRCAAAKTSAPPKSVCMRSCAGSRLACSMSGLVRIM